jgi:hypothetical protein
MVYIRYFWQGDHQIYGQIRCIFMVLAGPTLHTCAPPAATFVGLARTIYIVYNRYFGQGDHQIYGQIRYIFMVLAGPTLHTCASPAATLVGLARTIYIQCTTGILGREIAKYTVKYGIYIWFWLGQPNTLAHHQLPPHLCITSCRHTCLPSKQATMYKKGLFVNTHYTCNTLHTRKQRPHHTPPPPANTHHLHPRLRHRNPC